MQAIGSNNRQARINAAILAVELKKVTKKSILQQAKEYGVNSLLSDGDSNTKIAKSEKSGKGYMTAIMHLAPSDVSGFNVCQEASEGCAGACLFTAGRGRFENVHSARINRTRLLFLNRKLFLSLLIKEISAHRVKAKKAGKIPAVRLNGTSDLPWERIFPQLFTIFSDVVFYDYSKVPSRLGKTPSNYHLTFSRSETNNSEVIKALENGHNVAIVFSELPDYYMGYKVINGDEDDLRFLDPENVIVGLSAKGEAKKDESGFVVDPTPQAAYENGFLTRQEYATMV
jgi:hypothetical protein